MSKFTPQEIAYLQSQRVGRLATVNTKGQPHVVPVSFRYNPEQESIDISGYDITSTKKYRDAVRTGLAAFVVDDMSPANFPRMIEVRGTIEALPEGGPTILPVFPPEMLRITPRRIISLGVNSDIVRPDQGKVDVSSRSV